MYSASYLHNMSMIINEKGFFFLHGKISILVVVNRIDTVLAIFPSKQFLNRQYSN